MPFQFLNGLDIDPITGIAYFTDASSVYQQREIHEANARHEATGRLTMFNPGTKKVRVLLRGPSLAFGTAVSMDGSFVLVSEYAGKRIRKFWLTGPKANASEIIRRFWVAVNRETRVTRVINHRGKLIVPIALRIDSDGAVLDEIILLDQYQFIHHSS